MRGQVRREVRSRSVQKRRQQGTPPLHPFFSRPSSRPYCTHWSWISPEAESFDPVFHKSCWLKRRKRRAGKEDEQRILHVKGVFSGVSGRGKEGKRLIRRLGRMVQEEQGEFIRR